MNSRDREDAISEHENTEERRDDRDHQTTEQIGFERLSLARADF
jgi:hypothetical protein